MGSVCCGNSELLENQDPFAKNRSPKPLSPNNEPANTFGEFKPRTYKKGHGTVVNAALSRSCQDSARTGSFTTSPSLVQTGGGAALNQTTSISKETLYFEQKQREQKLNKEMLDMILKDKEKVKKCLRIQSLVRGVIQRKLTKKKYGFWAQWHRKDQHNYYNPFVRDIRKRLPKFNYDQPAPIQDDVERTLVKKKLEENEAIYEGQISVRTGLRDGKGMQVWTDGSIYEGYWKDGKSHGRGRLIHADGDVYEGQWVDDKAHGRGKYSHADGAVYEGEWLNDKQHGRGVEKWIDGSTYEGFYVEGLKDGYGQFKWPDGSQYQGSFKNNNIHGFGTYVWADKRTYKGDWKHNKMHGKGVFTWMDGRKYEGQYYDDKKHGKGIFIWPDGKKYDGNWQYGKQHGIGWYWQGQLAEKRQGEWVDGKRVKWINSHE